MLLKVPRNYLVPTIWWGECNMRLFSTKYSNKQIILYYIVLIGTDKIQNIPLLDRAHFQTLWGKEEKEQHIFNQTIIITRHCDMWVWNIYWMTPKIFMTFIVNLTFDMTFFEIARYFHMLHSLCSWVWDLAHEENTFGASVCDEHKERPVDFN